MVKTFTNVHKMPRYLFIYYKISFAQTVDMIEQKVAYNIIIQGTTILD